MLNAGVQKQRHPANSFLNFQFSLKPNCLYIALFFYLFRLICQDGGLQIDPSVMLSFMKDRTTFLGHALLMAHESIQTIILPNIYVQDLHQFMALLHKVRKFFMCFLLRAWFGFLFERSTVYPILVSQKLRFNVFNISSGF